MFALALTHCCLLCVCLAPVCSPLLHRVSYLVSKKADLDEALIALMSIRELKQLELVVRNFVLTADELRVIGERAGRGAEGGAAAGCTAGWAEQCAMCAPRPPRPCMQCG